MLMDVKNKHGI